MISDFERRVNGPERSALLIERRKKMAGNGNNQRNYIMTPEEQKAFRIAFWLCPYEGTPCEEFQTSAPNDSVAQSVQSAPQQALLNWAVEQWKAQVGSRPDVPRQRRLTLDSVWRQVMRYAGGDPDKLVGPRPESRMRGEYIS